MERCSQGKEAEDEPCVLHLEITALQEHPSPVLSLYVTEEKTVPQ